MCSVNLKEGGGPLKLTIRQGPTGGVGWRFVGHGRPAGYCRTPGPPTSSARSPTRPRPPACSVYWEFSHSGADGGRTGRNRTKMITALSGARPADMHAPGGQALALYVCSAAGRTCQRSRVWSTREGQVARLPVCSNCCALALDLPPNCPHTCRGAPPYRRALHLARHRGWRAGRLACGCLRGRGGSSCRRRRNPAVIMPQTVLSASQLSLSSFNLQPKASTRNLMTSLFLIALILKACCPFDLPAP